MVWKTLGQAAVTAFGAGAGRAAMEHVIQGSGLVPGRGRRAGRRAKAPGRVWKRVKGIPIYRDVEWDQYVVVPDLGHEAGWYHTDDREDAVQTAGWISENEPHAVKGSSARGRRATVPGQWLRRVGYGSLLASTFAVGGMGNQGRRNREINPYSKRYTFDQFKKRYFGNRPVPRQIAKEFWSDFRYAFHGGLGKYIDATTDTGSASKGRRNCVCY